MIFHHFPGYSMPPEIWKSLITPIFLYLSQNRWHQQTLCENIHLPALFKVVFSSRESIFRAIFIFSSEFLRGLSAFYDIISALSVIETSWNSAKYCILHEESVGAIYFDVIAEIGELLAIFRNFLIKMPKKCILTPLWRHNVQIFAKIVFSSSMSPDKNFEVLEGILGG